MQYNHTTQRQGVIKQQDKKRSNFFLLARSLEIFLETKA